MISFKKKLVEKLVASGIEQSEAVSEMDIFLEEICGLTKMDFLLNPNLEISDEAKQKIEKFLDIRIESRKPVQYIVNSAYFMGEKFYVDENVLIPRPDTEILVNETMRIINEMGESTSKELSIVDIGTGSGCIPIIIAKNCTGKTLKITAIDTSKPALLVAKKNAENLGVVDKINFIHSNILLSVDEKFDVIISNPPYIPESEKENLQLEVVKHEPHLALFAEDEEGICYYEEIIKQAGLKLNSQGFVVFEVGINQAEKVRKLFEQANFFNINVIPDLQGVERVVSGQKA